MKHRDQQEALELIERLAKNPFNPDIQKQVRQSADKNETFMETVDHCGWPAVQNVVDVIVASHDKKRPLHDFMKTKSPIEIQRALEEKPPITLPNPKDDATKRDDAIKAFEQDPKKCLERLKGQRFKPFAIKMLEKLIQRNDDQQENFKLIQRVLRGESVDNFGLTKLGPAYGELIVTKGVISGGLKVDLADANSDNRIDLKDREVDADLKDRLADSAHNLKTTIIEQAQNRQEALQDKQQHHKEAQENAEESKQAGPGGL